MQKLFTYGPREKNNNIKTFYQFDLVKIKAFYQPFHNTVFPESQIIHLLSWLLGFLLWLIGTCILQMTKLTSTMLASHIFSGQKNITTYSTLCCCMGYTIKIHMKARRTALQIFWLRHRTEKSEYTDMLRKQGFSLQICVRFLKQYLRMQKESCAGPHGTATLAIHT